MVEQGDGRVVMTSSVGMFGPESAAHYAAAKGGVFGLMRAVSVEGRPHGIAANGIIPTAVTPVVEELGAQDTDLLSDAFDPSPASMLGTRAPVWCRTAAVVAVAATLALGGCRGSESTDDDPAGQLQDDGETLAFVANDQLQFDQAPEQTSAGRHAVDLVVEGSINHNVVFAGVADDLPVVEADGGQTTSGSVELQPGTYTYYCSVPGHRSARMEGTLTVE